LPLLSLLLIDVALISILTGSGFVFCDLNFYAETGALFFSGLATEIGD